MRIEKIPVSNLYFPYKPRLEYFYKTYFRKKGNLLWIGNIPHAIFAEDYLKQGKRILKHLDSHIFIQYEYDRYKDEQTVIDDTHKYAAANRIIEIVDSINIHGYGKGKYKHSRHLITVTEGFSSPYGSDENGYTLKSRKHRASVVAALGLKKIKVQVKD
tara:strand:- start:577 stop:1053 length:477 start_codon:yes stop_codon:yes gene_type:complete